MDIDKKHKHLFKEKEFGKTWSSGGFGDGTLIRNCKCGYFEVMYSKTTKWEYGGMNWTWKL